MPRYALTAMGADRPGIVAAVTGALVDAEANLLDASMTGLAGQFAIMLVLDAPVDDAGVTAAVQPVADRFGLTVSVRPAADATPDEGKRHVLTVYGADRPGIVHQVTTALADHGVNVVDLSTRVTGDPASPAYVMLLDLSVPAGTETAVAAALGDVAAALGVDCHLRADDPDIL